MGNRISKVYTRTGDEGQTGLGDGSRVHKSDIRIQAIGDVDELNCLLGVLVAGLEESSESLTLLQIQHDLFDLGGELATPGMQLISAAQVTALESCIDKLNLSLPPLREFILPGGSPAAAQCHLARAVCRRAEREIVSLHNIQAVSDELIAYINRLSDLLFVLARCLARADGGKEVLWDRKRFAESL